MLTQRMMKAAGARASTAFQWEYIDGATSTTTGSSADFGSFSIPRAGLVVVGLGVHGDNTRLFSSVSIGGSNGGLEQFSSSSQLRKRGVAWREVAAGSQNITVTLTGTNGTSAHWRIAVYLLNNYTEVTPTLTSFPSAASINTSISIMHSLIDNSFVLYGVMTTGGSGAPYSWSTATSATGGVLNGNSIDLAYKPTISDGSHTETASGIGSPSTTTIIYCASWN